MYFYLERAYYVKIAIPIQVRAGRPESVSFSCMQSAAQKIESETANVKTEGQEFPDR